MATAIEETEMVQADPQVSASLEAEIDAGLDAAMAEMATDRAQADAESAADVLDPLAKPEPTEADDDTTEVVDEGEQAEETEEAAEPVESEPETIDDDLLSRAVLAGIPLSEARQYPNPTLLGNVCDRLEKQNTKPDDSDSDSDDAPAEPADIDTENVLASMPYLDPEIYDEKIIAGFEAMKSLVTQQKKTIESLGVTQGVDWFEAQVKGLDTQVQTALQNEPQKRDALRLKFDVLTAGYKAAGQAVERTAIFQEATEMTLRAELAESGEEAKKAALGKRAGQFINRPASRQSKPRGDVLEDIASEVDEKFFSKT